MKPYTRAHDIDNPELRDYYVWTNDQPTTRRRWPRALVCLVAALVLACAAFVCLQF